MSDKDLEVVRAFNNRPEADMAVSALEAAGIDAMIRADDGGSMRPSVAWAGVGFEVIVRSEDSEAAHAILEIPARTMPEQA
jgi:hypothetical protein